jgi:hypothetical protein
MASMGKQQRNLIGEPPLFVQAAPRSSGVLTPRYILGDFVNVAEALTLGYADVAVVLRAWQRLRCARLAHDFLDEIVGCCRNWR